MLRATTVSSPILRQGVSAIAGDVPPDTSLHASVAARVQAALALQDCCAVLATVLAAEPSLRDGLAARGSRGWDKLRTVMEAALSEADRRQLQPILQQVRHHSCRA